MGENLTDSQKLEMVIDALGINKNKLAKSVGLNNPGAIYAIVAGRNNLSKGMMKRIIQAYPNVSYNFMMGAELPVLLDQQQTQAQMNVLNVVPQSSDFQMLRRIMDIPDQLDRIESKLDKLLGKE
ncbi:MAG: hypothetical protein AB3N18_00635 [Allomuricauda sp.]